MRNQYKNSFLKFIIYSGQWPETDDTSDLNMPFKDARSFMSEMPDEREVIHTFTRFDVLTLFLSYFDGRHTVYFAVQQNRHSAKLLQVQLRC